MAPLTELEKKRARRAIIATQRARRNARLAPISRSAKDACPE